MIYKIECWDNLGDRLIWHETVFSPEQVDEALCRMRQRKEWKSQDESENPINIF